MTNLRVIGVDPGPTPGIVCLDFSDPGLLEVHVVQSTRRTASLIVEAFLREVGDPLGSRCDAEVLMQVEAFIMGKRAAGKASTETRELIGELGNVSSQWDVTVMQRRATDVKPWATDERLDAAGLLAATKGMRHARDAARHALFRAVRDGGIPDPLSKEWKF